jgi:hypothetical protein
MKNFLSIVWYRVLPPLYGGQQGIAYFNEELGRKIPLTCLCSKDNVSSSKVSYTVQNELPISKLQFWDPTVKRQILSTIRMGNFTDVIIEHPYHGWLGKYKSKYGFRLIVHAHNIEFLRMKARGKLWWRIIRKTERTAFKMADLILFKTKEDIKIATRVFTIEEDKCLLVPFGTNKTMHPASLNEAIHRITTLHKIAPEEKILLFAATLDYEPNQKALNDIMFKIVPALRAKGLPFRMIICGAMPDDQLKTINSLSNITATGFVSSIDDYFLAADVFINPVNHGAGIQTKNIEAIASGCNLVCTPFAATGLPGYLDEKVFVAGLEDPGVFIEAIIKATMSKPVVPLRFYDEYGWKGIVNRLLDSLAANGKGVTLPGK